MSRLRNKPNVHTAISTSVGSIQSNKGTIKMQTAFPFTLEDLQSWTVKRTDGSVTIFKLLPGGSTQQQQQQTHHHSNFYGRTTHGFGDFCTHTPGGIPSASFDRGGNPDRKS